MFRYYLTIGGTETEILEPVGWDKMESILKRHPTKHGIQVEFSEVPLTFYCGGGGYEQLLAEYEANGSDGQATFRQDFDCNGITTLYQATVNFNDLQHLAGEFISANLEIVGFGNLLQTREKSKISMNSTQDLDGNTIPKAFTATLDMYSRAVKKELDAITPEQLSTTIQIPNSEPERNQLFIQPEWLDITLDEIQDTYHYPFGWSETSIPAANAYLIDVKEAGTYTIEAEINYQLDVAMLSGVLTDINDLEFRWILRIDSTETALSNTIFITGSLPDPDSDNIYRSGPLSSTISTTVDLAVGQKIYLFGYLTHGFVSVINVSAIREFTLYQNSGSQINISSETVTNRTYSDVWSIPEVYRQVILGTTGQADRFKSDYFAGCGANYCLTTGFNIRQFPDYPLTISREELFSGLAPIFAVGEGITLDGPDEIVEVEPVEYFYQSNEIIRFDNPADYLEEVAGEFIYNALETGYEKSNTDEFNALDEFNGKREWQTPIKTNENKFTAVSKFVASMYAIESQRRKPYVDGNKVSGSFDKDTFVIANIPSGFRIKSVQAPDRINLDRFVPSGVTVPTVNITGSEDNDGTYTVTSVHYQNTYVWITVSPDLPNPAEQTGQVVAIVNGNPTAYVPEANEPFDTVNNLISPETMYNGRISPARNLRRWAKVINSGLWFKDPAANSIRFTAGEANNDFATQFDAAEPCPEGDPDKDYIAENGEILLNDFNQFAQLWKPEIISFKAPVTADQMALIRAAHIPQIDAEDKHGYITVFDGYEYQSGYLLELRYRDAEQTDELSAFKLIKKWDSPLAVGLLEHSIEFSDEYA